MSSLLQREQKYQFIKLIQSGINLNEANFLHRVVHTASMGGIMSDSDFNRLNAILDKLELLKKDDMLFKLVWEKSHKISLVVLLLTESPNREKGTSVIFWIIIL